MIMISSATLSLVEARFPYLEGLCNRYRMLEGLYEQASYEVDERIKRLGLRNDQRDDSELQFLTENLNIVEDELDTTGRQIAAILRSQYESRQD